MQRKVHRLEWEYQKRTELHRMSEEKDKDRLFLISILSNDTYHISKHTKKIANKQYKSAYSPQPTYQIYGKITNLL